jgi:hypothetical protein
MQRREAGSGSERSNVGCLGRFLLKADAVVEGDPRQPEIFTTRSQKREGPERDVGQKTRNVF